VRSNISCNYFSMQLVSQQLLRHAEAFFPQVHLGVTHQVMGPSRFRRASSVDGDGGDRVNVDVIPGLGGQQHQSKLAGNASAAGRAPDMDNARVHCTSCCALLTKGFCQTQPNHRTGRRCTVLWHEVNKGMLSREQYDCQVFARLWPCEATGAHYCLTFY
jgi:hypothetical protein